MNSRAVRVFRHYFDNDLYCYDPTTFAWVEPNYVWQLCGVIPIMTCPRTGTKFVLYSDLNKLWCFSPLRELRRPYKARGSRWVDRTYVSPLCLGPYALSPVTCETFDDLISSFDPYTDCNRNDPCLIASRSISIETRGLITVDPEDLRKGEYHRVVIDGDARSASIFFFVEVPWMSDALEAHNRNIMMSSKSRRRSGLVRTISMYSFEAIKSHLK